MKKLLLILLCLPMIGFGQQTYVPDDNFEAYLEAHSMGNGIANDDSVLTANISAISELDIPAHDIDDFTGIEDFIALVELWCNDNDFTTIDLSNTTLLEFLRIDDCKLTNLDISNNIKLKELRCDGNLLESLDCSNNLDLESLDCHDNQIKCLDLSFNVYLEEIICDFNILEQLNIKNGNWQNMSVEATANNLTCVEVNNIGYATSNWASSFDSFVTFSINCNYTNPCSSSTSIAEHTTNKALLKVTDLLGRKTKQTNQPLFYIYDDGTVEKRIVIE